MRADEAVPPFHSRVGATKIARSGGRARGSVGLMVRKLLVSIGSVGPLGHAPASGTVTVAVVGVPLFWATAGWPVAWTVALLVGFSAAAVAVHDICGRILGEKDSPILVWDEIAGYLVATAGFGFSWPLALLAFFVERAIDIVKIYPASWIDRHGTGGLGDVGDDLVAGAYAWLCLRIVAHFVPGLL